jgi:hypothetical protein
MAIFFEDGVHIYAVKYKVIQMPPNRTKEFPCEHCPSLKATPQMDIVQFGFLDDKHQLICYCPDCFQLTVYEYAVGDEHA